MFTRVIVSGGIFQVDKMIPIFLPTLPLLSWMKMSLWLQKPRRCWIGETVLAGEAKETMDVAVVKGEM